MGKAHFTNLNVYRFFALSSGHEKGKSALLQPLYSRWDWWNGHVHKIPKPAPTVIAVVGPYRSGTSCIAGALHYLGIPMGKQFLPTKLSAGPKGTFEAVWLHRTCQNIIPEPAFEFNPQIGPRRRVQALRQWAVSRSDEAIVGAKDPKLCFLVPEILEAWPNCKIIAVDRTLAASAASLSKLGWFGQWHAETLIAHMVAMRDETLARVHENQVFFVNFDDFLTAPETHLESLAEFAGIEPLPEQTQQALAFIDPELRHYP